MIAYIARRLIQAVPLLLIITFIGFVLVQATGDPLAAFTVDASLTAEDMARLRRHYGLDQPIPIQYLNWLKNMLTGDWGTSYYTRENVFDMVLERLPNTLLLVAISYTAVLAIGLVLGVVSAVRQYSVLDHVVTGLSFVGIAMPTFWLGLMLIVVFAVRFKLLGLPYFPVGGMYDQRLGSSIGQVLWHAILPSVTLSVVIAARYVRYVRAAVIEQIHLDYIRTARAKGLGERLIIARHALKNALLPLITLVALDIPDLLSGAIVTESIFAWPGMGRLFWSAAERTDIPVLMAVMLLVAALNVLCSLIADICYALVDPRIKYS
jgi:peptide/nickel transport system permease protein